MHEREAQSVLAAIPKKNYPKMRKKCKLGYKRNERNERNERMTRRAKRALNIASKASKLEVGVGVTNNCWQPTIGSSLQR